MGGGMGPYGAIGVGRFFVMGAGEGADEIAISEVGLCSDANFGLHLSARKYCRYSGFHCNCNAKTLLYLIDYNLTLYSMMRLVYFFTMVYIQFFCD